MTWVVLEGIDGAGKSTLLNGIASKLPLLFSEDEAPEIVVTREPGGPGVPATLRHLALTAGLKVESRQELMAVDARLNFDRNVAPYQGVNAIVLQDRGEPSAAVYSGLEDPLVESYGHYGVKPDMYIWVKCDPVVAHLRLQNRGAEDHFDAAPLSALQRRHEAYRAFFRDCGVPTLSVDTNRPPYEPRHHAETVAWWVADRHRILEAK